MELSTLETFIDVMRLGSFAAVARDRNVDPSSISRTISGLEKELGIRLFQRTTRQLSATEAGTAYFERIAPLIEEIQEAHHIAGDLSGQPRGELRVTTSVSFGMKCIVPLLPRIASIYPELTIDFLMTDAVVDLVAERVDLAIRLGILPDSTLIAQRLMQTRYRVCASPDYVRQVKRLDAPDDIEHHNCLLFPIPGFRSKWMFRDREGTISEVPVSGRTIISNALALQQCAISGMGIALLPHWLVDDEVNAGRLIHLFPEYDVTATDFSNAVWFVYPSRAYMPAKVRIFVDFLKREIAKPV